jgi:cleavage and polyadenylation specificity factor subunit 1
VSLAQHRLFVGSEVADSVLLSTARKVSQSKKHSSRSGQRPIESGTADAAEDEEDDEDEDDDDDLYGDAIDKSMIGQSEGVTTAGTNVRIVDRLHCIAPLRDIAIGRVGKRKRGDDDTGREDVPAELNLVAASGEGMAGGVTFFDGKLQHTPVSKTKISRANGVWSFSVKPPAAALENLGVDRSYDEFIILSKYDDAGQAESTLYQVSGQLPQVKLETDFDPSAGGTIECGSITNGAHIVQVLEAEIRVYDRGKRTHRSFYVLTDMC